MRAVLVCCLGAFLGVAASCRAADSQHQGLEPTYDQATGRLRELSHDSDNDGLFEMKALMNGNRVLRVDVDENRDGLPDRWEYYEPIARDASHNGAQAAATDPSLVRVERATRRDGKVTRKEGFKDGALAWVEEDRDGDGRTDRWETYVDGALSTLALDTKGRGSPDRQISYLGDTVRIKEQ